MNTQAISDALLDAESTKKPIDPLTVTYPGLTAEEAYRVQLAGVQAKTRQGRRIVGKKIGLTSKAMQDLFGVPEPDYGHLFDSMLVPEGQPCRRADLLLPRVEGEVAFVLKETLKGPGVTIADVLRATEGVMPAIEIVDSRIRDWKIKLPDTVADNASSGLFVLGGRMTPVKEIDLRLVGMYLEKNGQVVNSGAGVAVLGHPAASVAWLANKMAEFDISLGAGEVILSGAVTAAVEAAAGDSFHVFFQGLGSVGVRFV